MKIKLLLQEILTLLHHLFVFYLYFILTFIFSKLTVTEATAASVKTDQTVSDIDPFHLVDQKALRLDYFQFISQIFEHLLMNSFLLPGIF